MAGDGPDVSERPGSVGRKAPLPTDYQDLRDPANGEKVPRCGACGMPNMKALRGSWDGIPGMWFPVCANCIARYNGPQRTDTDPLHVPEDRKAA